MSWDCKKMYDETKSIEEQIAELLEAHSEKTRTLIRTINLEWMDLSSMNKEIKKVRAVNIDARTDIL